MKLVYLLLSLMIIIPFVSAIPTTNAVTNIQSGFAQFNAAGGAGVGWFKWGQINGGPYYWTTPNQSVSGAFTDSQYGPPMLTGTTYYVVACDTSGCGNQIAFAVPAAGALNQTHYGDDVITMQRYGLNVTKTMSVFSKPYTATMTAPVAWGLLFFFIFTGMWMRPRDIFIPCMMAIVSGGAIWFGAGSLGVPPEWAAIGQGLLYAAVAGIAFSWFTH